MGYYDTRSESGKSTVEVVFVGYQAGEAGVVLHENAWRHSKHHGVPDFLVRGPCRPIGAALRHS